MSTNVAEENRKGFNVCMLKRRFNVSVSSHINIRTIWTALILDIVYLGVAESVRLYRIDNGMCIEVNIIIQEASVHGINRKP